MNDQLHPTRLVEEPLEHDGVEGRQGTQRGTRRGEVLHELRSRRSIQTEPPGELFARRAFARARGHFFAQARHRVGELVATSWCFAQPEGNGRRLSVGVLDAHPARLDAQDTIRSVAKLEDVARKTLDGEVFVDRADLLSGG